MIFTERLHIRPIQSGDETLYHSLDQDVNVMKYITGKAFTDEESIEFFRSRIEFARHFSPLGNYMVFDGENFIGGANLNFIKNTTLIQIGYRLNERSWGKGYATEISKALVNFAFELGYDKLFAVTALENKASQRVLEKSGFSLKGRRFYYSEWVNFYAIKKEQLLAPTLRHKTRS